MKRFAALMMVLLTGLANAGQVESFDWVLAYSEGSTNRLIGDKRTERMVNQRVPATLSKEVVDALWGSPDPVHVEEDRFMWMSACLPHYCPVKGFFWIDTRTGVGLGAVLTESYAPVTAELTGTGSLKLASNGMQYDSIPVKARRALTEWITELGILPVRVAFSGSTGEWKELNPAEFKPRQKYIPAAGGPSFDCGKATGPVARTICSSPELSKADLELFQQVESMWQSMSTIPAREQLAALQKDWIRLRDSECAVANDGLDCLGTRYRAQRESLRHWVPVR
jgi:hypothetical protein